MTRTQYFVRKSILISIKNECGNLTDTKICLNCSFEFKETQCPLCGWDPEKSDEPDKKDVKITLVFEKNKDKNFEDVLTIAKKANFKL